MKEKSSSILIINSVGKAEDILIDIKKTLIRKKISLADITAILVNLTPDSYTGVRVGATIANTLAWSLDIPVFGYTAKTYPQVLKKAQKNGPGFTQIVLPTYSTNK